MGETQEAHFRRLAELYAAAMRRLCGVYARTPADREDLFQEIFLAIWKGLPAFRGDASERTWVYRIAHNVAITWQAKNRRVQNSLVVLEETDMPITAPHNVRRMILMQTVSQMPPVDREIVSLWLEGLSNGEIAEVTGIRSGAVAVRLTRIRQQLAAEALHG